MQDIKFNELRWQLSGLNTKMDSLKSTVSAILARELAPHMPLCKTPTRAFVPVVTSISQATMTATSVSPVTTATKSVSPVTMAPTPVDMVTIPVSQELVRTTPQLPTTTQVSPILACDTPQISPTITQVSSEVEVTDMPSLDDSLDGGHMSLRELTNVYTKSTSRRNFAANLVRSLFTREERMRCNVKGRGKDMLNPTLIEFVKTKCFEFFPLPGSENVKDKWAECIVSIDEANRRLKNKPTKKQALST